MRSEKCGVSREAAPANFPGLKILYTEAVEQWQKHITGTHPMSASLIVRLHRLAFSDGITDELMLLHGSSCGF